MSIGELRTPQHFLTSLVKGSTGDAVGWGFFKSESPSFALSAADNALRSGFGDISEPLLDVLNCCFEALAPCFHGCVKVISVLSVTECR